MNPRTRWSVQRKLLAFSAAVIVPMALFAYLLIRENARYTREQLLNSSAATANVVRSNVDTFLADTERLLYTLAQIPAVKASDPVRTTGLFIDTLPQQPSFLNLFAADATGEVFAAVVRRGEDSRNIAGWDEFQQVLDSGEAVVSGRRISRPTGRVAISVLAPLRDDAGNIIGAIGADISLEELQDALADIEARKRATIIVADQQGLVLVHPNYRYVYEETSLAELPPVLAALRGEEGAIEYHNPLDEQTWLAAYAPLAETGWLVIVAHPVAAIDVQVQNAIVRGLVSLLVVTLLAAAVSALSARTITRSLDRLAQAARAIARGDLRQRVEVETRDELQAVAEAFNTMSVSLAETVEDLARTKEELARNSAQLQRLLTKTVHTQEEERARIAADIHDGVTQLIIGALYEIQTAQTHVSDHSNANARLQEAHALLHRIVTEMRRVIFDLRPHTLDHLGLAAALQKYVREYCNHGGVTCHVRVAGAPMRFARHAEIGLYRIVQEALQNVTRHAQATMAEVLVAFQPGEVQVMIEDDGQGFDPDQVRTSGHGLGLLDIEERAQAIGGQVRIESRLGSGTRIRVTVPLDSSVTPSVGHTLEERQGGNGRGK